MNTLRNSVHLIGRAGQEPEIRTFDNDRKMARFSLATDDAYTNGRGEKVNDTTWHNIVAWGKTAELIEQLVQKGAELALEGKLCNRSYTDKDGVKKYVSEIELREFVVVGRKQAATA